MMSTQNKLANLLLFLTTTLIIRNDTIATAVCGKADACYKSLMRDGHRTLENQDGEETEKICAAFEQCVFDAGKLRGDTATAGNNSNQSNDTSQTSMSLSELVCTCSLIDNGFLFLESSSSLCKIPDWYNNKNTCKRHAHLCLMLYEYRHDNISDHNPKYCGLLLQCVTNTIIDIAHLRQLMVFPRSATKYCPYNDFCLIKSSKQGSNGCTSCSCDYDCGKTRSCCYPDLDTYNIDTTMDHYELTSNLGDNSYYIVNTCADGSRCNLDIAPASSLTTNRIYLNADCAQCNCVQNYTIWDNGILCTSQTKTSLTTIPETRFCNEIISIPLDEHFDLAKRFICPESVHNTCRWALNTSLEISEGCTRTWAPLFSYRIPGRVYNNQFCAACNNDVDESNQNTRSIIDNNFAVIIDPEVANPYKTRQTRSEKCIPYEGLCRRVLCPEGTVCLESTCKYLYKQWTGITLSLQLRLLPLVYNNTLTLTNLKEMSQPELLKWLHPKCGLNFPKSYTTVYVYTQLFDVEIIVRKIQILTVYVKVSIIPSEFITTLKACLQSNWELHLNGTTHLYTTQLVGTPSINHQEEMSDETFGDTSDTTGIFTEPFIYSYEQLLNTSTTDYSVNLIVTKLMLCEQIELLSYEVKQDGGHIVLIHNKKRLRKGEYQNIPLPELADEFYYIVCVEDFLYVGDDKSYAHTKRLSAIWTVVMLGVVTCTVFYVSVMPN